MACSYGIESVDNNIDWNNSDNAIYGSYSGGNASPTYECKWETCYILYIKGTNNQNYWFGMIYNGYMIPISFGANNYNYQDLTSPDVPLSYNSSNSIVTLPSGNLWYKYTLMAIN